MLIGGSGLRDWVLQRLSAVYLGIYLIILSVFAYKLPHTYVAWQALFENSLVQITTLLALVCLMVHAWIGICTIANDYIKSTFIRYLFQSVVLLMLFTYFVWGINILWGV